MFILDFRIQQAFAFEGQQIVFNLDRYVVLVNAGELYFQNDSSDGFININRGSPVIKTDLIVQIP